LRYSDSSSNKEEKIRIIYESGIFQIFMVENKPVSLTRQTIYCLIPVLDMYAAYKVKRLRKYLVIMMLVVAVPVSIADYILFPHEIDAWEGFVNVMTYYYDVDTNQFVFSIAVQIVTISFAIFLIRRWSKQWNNLFVQ